MPSKPGPRGPWAAKIRFESIAVEALAAGRPNAAEALARAEAETLLSPDRKDRLAEVYHAFARRLLSPDDPISKPDPNAAYALLAKARELAKGETLRASLLFEMARAGQTPGAVVANGPPAQRGNPNPSINPIRDFQAYLKEYPKGADRFAARYYLGLAQLAVNQNVAARMTWTDLARDLSTEIAKAPSKELAELRARSLYQITRTHGIPTPPDDTQAQPRGRRGPPVPGRRPPTPRPSAPSYEIGAVGPQQKPGQRPPHQEPWKAF